MTQGRSRSSEEWAPFPRDPRYLVSTQGQVKGVRGSIIRPQACGNERQYRKVRTRLGSNTRVDYMVLETFVGPRPLGTECCHANDIQSDNRLCNLRWATHKENCADRANNGRMDETYRRNRKADPSRVQLMRKQGLTFRQIGEQLGISDTTAYRNSK